MCKLRFIFLLSFVLASGSVEATAAKETFLYEGGRSSIQFDLESEKTHIEYRQVWQEQTCYRSVYVGHRPYCFYRMVNYCSRDMYGRPYCRPVRRQFCEPRPYYENQPYRCSRQVMVPHEVKDFDVDGKFTVSFGPSPRGITPYESFEMTLTGVDHDLSVNSSQNLLIYRDVETRVVDHGESRELMINYSLKFKKLSKIVSPVSRGINQMRIEGNNLQFSTGLVSENGPISVSLSIVHPYWGGRYTVFNRELRNSEYGFFHFQDQIV